LESYEQNCMKATTETFAALGGRSAAKCIISKDRPFLT